MIAILPQAQNEPAFGLQSKLGPCTAYVIGQHVAIQGHSSRVDDRNLESCIADFLNAITSSWAFAV